MKIPFYFFTLILGLSLISCQQNESGDQTDSQAETQETQPTSAAGTTMESLPVSKLEEVFANADYADFIFYQPSFSMSQDEKASIQQVLALIAAQPATLNPNCKPRGRVFYQKQGVDILVADIYLGDGCNYFVFLENEKPVYANKMIPQGVQYFNNNIQQVLQMQQQAQ
ncbi:MAG: hypothetical protein GYB31_08130 [Bacteroidetes bacterium]|nr:hypothetical protein [Bacteroidota bacterium]